MSDRILIPDPGADLSEPLRIMLPVHFIHPDGRLAFLLEADEYGQPMLSLCCSRSGDVRAQVCLRPDGQGNLSLLNGRGVTVAELDATDGGELQLCEPNGQLRLDAVAERPGASLTVYRDEEGFNEPILVDGIGSSQVWRTYFKGMKRVQRKRKRALQFAELTGTAAEVGIPQPKRRA